MYAVVCPDVGSALRSLRLKGCRFVCNDAFISILACAPQDCLEYLVKWRDTAYLHAEWVTSALLREYAQWGIGRMNRMATRYARRLCVHNVKMHVRYTNVASMASLAFASIGSQVRMNGLAHRMFSDFTTVLFFRTRVRPVINF